MNIESALKKAINIFKNAQNISPAVDAGVILCYVLNCNKTFLFTHYDYELDSEEIKTYFTLIDIRAEGTPIQYIIGQKEFMSLNFVVNSNVLIPRPETEVLVESIINYIKSRISESHIKDNYILKERIPKNHTNKDLNVLTEVVDKKPQLEKDVKEVRKINDINDINDIRFDILDIGTGSGCIAVSLAYYIKNCHVTAVDISEKALDIAYLNACSNEVIDKITFITGDLFEKLSGMTFDIIVSNPPYISSYEIRSLQTEVKDHEPIIALDGGKDGLYYYKRIIEEAPCFLNTGGILAFEVGYNQACRVTALMKRHFSKIEIIKDLEKIDRVVIGYIASM